MRAMQGQKARVLPHADGAIGKRLGPAVTSNAFWAIARSLVVVSTLLLMADSWDSAQQASPWAGWSMEDVYTAALHVSPPR